MKPSATRAPTLPLLLVLGLTAGTALMGCEPHQPQQDEDATVPATSSEAAPADPEGALPPAPMEYADPGTVQDYSHLGYDALVEELHGGGHPDALFFSGILPCADCPGIRTKLTLVSDHRLYVLRQTYLEADEGRNATYTVVGSWGEEPGALDERPAAPVFRLAAAEGDPPQMMLTRIAVDTLRLLDREGRWIDSELPYELVRVRD